MPHSYWADAMHTDSSDDDGTLNNEDNRADIGETIVEDINEDTEEEDKESDLDFVDSDYKKSENEGELLQKDDKAFENYVDHHDLDEDPNAPIVEDEDSIDVAKSDVDGLDSSSDDGVKKRKRKLPKFEILGQKHTWSSMSLSWVAPAPNHSPSLDPPLILFASSFSSCSLCLPTSQALLSPPSPAPDPPASTVTHSSSPALSIFANTYAISAHEPNSLVVPPIDPSCPSHPPVSPPTPTASRFSHTYIRNLNRKLFFSPLAPISSGPSSPPIFDTSLANKHKEWLLAMTDEFNALICART
ncbi:unnamed protein product [Prunus armeniaca]|uniref:Uncharacterized protein n=1 Tax=Prunus armeniaca TaxID=36596 RepID=A0A6J5VLI2_PRUAR|nr:unnamed protein product [Prunus armeniaca]